MTEMEAAGGVLDLVGKYGVTLVGLVIVSVGLWRLIKRILDQYEAEKKSYLKRMEELTDRFGSKESDFIDALNGIRATIVDTNKLQSELAETNRLLVDKIEADIRAIGGNVNLILERLDRKWEGK